MKKIIALALCALMCMTALVGCGTKDDGKYTIGICQLAPHVALDAATQGFKDAVVAALGEENVDFIEQNAAGENSTAVTIVNDFVTKDVDLIMANATGALQAAANATADIPVLGTSITEYGVALGIDNFDGVVGTNISGTSDLAPLDDQAQMIIDLFPETKKVGILFCSAEANSRYQVDVVKAYLEGKGITVTEYSFTDSSDIATVAAACAADSDVIYVPTDNKAAECAETINNVVLPTKTPIITGDSGTCTGCGVACYSISYYELGKKTGNMAVDVLTGKADISEMAIDYDPNPVKQYNAAICEELGIELPEEYEPIE